MIWSSFDFLSGPILKFVWETDFSNENINDSISVDETVDGNISTGSSTSKVF